MKVDLKQTFEFCVSWLKNRMMEGFFGFVLELNIYKLIRQHEELYKIEHEIFTCQCQGL